MVLVVPAILTSSTEELQKLLVQAEAVVKRVQIDIIDGDYVDNKTIDPEVFENLDTDLLLDFHLMVKEPKNWVERCVRAGADRIIGQIEMMSSQEEFVGKVQEVGAYVGLAVDLDTPVENLESSIINTLDAVLVMSVQAGYGGQKFEPKAIEKIERLDKIRERDETPFKIIDDGGITFENMGEIRLAGVDEVAIGRRLFDGDLKENIDKLVIAAYKK